MLLVSNNRMTVVNYRFPFSASTLLVWRQEGCPACKKKLRIGLLVVTLHVLIAPIRDGTGSPGHGSVGHRVSNLGPGRVGSRVKALTRVFDPDSCSMLWKIVGKVKVLLSSCVIVGIDMLATKQVAETFV